MRRSLDAAYAAVRSAGYRGADHRGPLGPWEQVELPAAVSNAGALSSVGTALRDARELREHWNRLRELTDAPFAINHTIRPFDEEAFAATLAFAPAAVSFHLG